MEDVISKIQGDYLDLEVKEPGFLRNLLSFGKASDQHYRDKQRCREKCEKGIRNVIRSASNDCKKKILKAFNDFVYEIEDVINDKIKGDDDKGYDPKSLASKLRKDVETKVNDVSLSVEKSVKDFDDIFEFDPEPDLAPLAALRDEIIARVQDIVLKQGIGELRDKLKELKDDKAGREKKGKEAQQKAEELHAQILKVEEQIKEVASVI